MRAYRISRRLIVALGVAGLGLAWGCGGLLPPELVYDLHVDPILPEGRGDYSIDLEDSAMVFSHEGLLSGSGPYKTLSSMRVSRHVTTVSTSIPILAPKSTKN